MTYVVLQNCEMWLHHIPITGEKFLYIANSQMKLFLNKVVKSDACTAL